MAHVWILHHYGDQQTWHCVPIEPMLSENKMDLSMLVVNSINERGVPILPEGEVSLLMQPDGGTGLGPIWILLTCTDIQVRVNGQRLVGGIKILRDRDELNFSGTRIYFSTEQIARVEPYPVNVNNRPVQCPRCRQDIEAGKHQAVRCPKCATWHHQHEELSCWTYTERCAVCAHPTGLDLGYSWTPEALYYVA